MQKKEKHNGICWDENTKTKQQTNMTMKVEDINLKKYWLKKEDLKDSKIMSSCTSKTEPANITKENSRMNEDKPTRDAKKAKQFCSKISERKEPKRKTEWINNTEKNHED